MNILVCNAQVPFVRGGAEEHAEGLVAALRERGHRADLVRLPFDWYPPREVLKSALAWRLLDLTESNGTRVDRIITMKFPSYAAQHPHKVVWLIHQFRQAYDWHGTPFGSFTGGEDDRRVRAQLIDLDRRALGEAQGLFTTSRNNAGRLQRYVGLTAEQLYAPPRLAGRLRSLEPGDYILSVGRLDQAKRVDLVLRALPEVPLARLVVVGDGPERNNLVKLAHTLGVETRVTLCDRVDDETVIDLYARARAVFYGPIDEDYGLVTVEAYLSERPVITTNDAGGVLEFVAHEQTGLVCNPVPAEIAGAIHRIYADASRAREWGRAGQRLVAGITWDRAVERLTA
ncbi:MAG: glycosyltransferase family 4 protein [Anaerolineae bacterium]